MSIWLCNGLVEDEKEGVGYRDLLFLSVNSGRTRKYDADKAPRASIHTSVGYMSPLNDKKTTSFLDNF